MPGQYPCIQKKGVNAGGAIFDKKFKRSEKIGFAVSREFYRPDYTAYPELDNKEIDNRQVMYWNASLSAKGFPAESKSVICSIPAGRFFLTIEAPDSPSSRLKFPL